MRFKIAAFLVTYKHLFFLGILFSLVISIKLNSIFIVLGFLQWALISNAEKVAFFKKNKLFIGLFIAYFLCFSISLIYSENLMLGWQDLESKLALIILPPLILGQKPLNKNQLKHLLTWYTNLMVLICVFMLALSFSAHYTLISNQALSSLIGMHASYLSLYLAIAVFFCLSELLNRKQVAKNAIVVVFLSIVLVFLSARMVLMAMVLSLFFWFVFIQFNWKRLLFISSAVLIIITIGWNIESVKSRFEEGLVGEEIKFQTIPKEQVTSAGGKAIRVAIWKCAKDVVAEHWLIGVGAGDVHEELQASYKRNEFQLAWQYNNYNSHNLFIETIIAVGISGVVILLILFSMLFYEFIRNKNILFFAFTSLFFLFSLIESSFNVQRGLVFLVLFSCLFWSVRNEPEIENLK